MEEKALLTEEDSLTTTGNTRVTAALAEIPRIAETDTVKSVPEKTNRGMNDWRPFLYGGLASITAECGTFPIDTTKTRLQIQGQVIDARFRDLKYRGMLHAFLRIFKEEGAHALYSGLAPALLRQATYGTIKIGVYHTLKRALISDPANETLAINVLCGIIAGITSSTIANPTDVLKVRMQARTNASCDNMVCSFVNIYKQEGVAGLWRGVGPTAQRAAIVSGVELPVYDVIKKHIILSGYLGDTKETHFLASFMAGFAGALASNPVDVCKTRMMNQKVKVVSAEAVTAGSLSAEVSPAIYTSTMDCLVRTVKTEGVTALYKGFIPNWLRLGPWNIIFFMTYEQLKSIY